MPIAADAAVRIRRIHTLLSVQSLVVVLLSINRLSGITTGYVAPNQFLRWTDLLNMLVLPVVSVLVAMGLREVTRSGATRRSGDRALSVVFVVGVYLLGAGYGSHEVTNYLHSRFCGADLDQMCAIIVYQDDEFSHWVFFSGFLLINLAVLLTVPLYPTTRPAVGWHVPALLGNGIVFGLAVFANLSFEPIGLDLYVVAALAVAALALWWRRRREPLLVYYLVVYWFGLLSTAVYTHVV
ncbi:hypothetical protein ACLQ2S_17245 [Micromonospora sp. DT48]|uniref:hypothetical protein n=1 Tax=unclassified Micromonospora TaxID=2617518 RepID=UPI0012BB8B1D|nr:hypothetical protein [Micromonospora sp. CP22]MTK03485.1 hypothetical protein [Micromonospora sp. CP22]